jgi:hypothetical protein
MVEAGLFSRAQKRKSRGNARCQERQELQQQQQRRWGQGPWKAATASWTAAQETGKARASSGWDRRAADGGGGGDGF